MQIAFTTSEVIPTRGTVVLGVAASDAHVVANHLIAMFLRRHHFHVINLGACTPTEEFMKAASNAPRLVAILIGSLNGHALEDLADLPLLKRHYRVKAPILLGGNLSVGAIKSKDIVESLLALGVDMIVQHPSHIVETLSRLQARTDGRPFSPPTVEPVYSLERSEA